MNQRSWFIQEHRILQSNEDLTSVTGVFILLIYLLWDSLA